MPETLRKVTAFITRSTEGGTQLLTFGHPTAGTQLPAGTVEAGEAIEAALLREVQEETGLSEVRVVRDLGTQVYELDGGWHLSLSWTHLLVGPRSDALRLGFYVTRGAWLQVTDQVGDFSEVMYEERDLNVDPPALLARIRAWMPSELLSARLERHFFHLTPTAPVPEAWDQPADGGHVFHLHWVPLHPRPRLVVGQDEWLDLAYERLLASVANP